LDDVDDEEEDDDEDEDEDEVVPVVLDEPPWRGYSQTRCAFVPCSSMHRRVRRNRDTTIPSAHTTTDASVRPASRPSCSMAMIMSSSEEAEEEEAEEEEAEDEAAEDVELAPTAPPEP
jgi:hypothetical protein